MDWLVALLAFVGAVVGAGATAWVALRGQRQEGRGEWRQRLDEAISLVTSDDPAKQQIGDELLADLIESDLGSDQDRDLARRIARIRLGHELEHRDHGVAEVDLAAGPGDNGSDEPKETP